METRRCNVTMAGKTPGLLAAMDVGTAFCGYMSCLPGGDKIQCGLYPDQPGSWTYCKMPSAVLFERTSDGVPKGPEGWKLVALGHSIEEHLLNYTPEERERDLVLVTNPKLLLTQPPPPHVKAPEGITAEDVVTAWLAELRRLAVAGFHDQWGLVPGCDLSTIQWSFTVPASWDDSTKAIMRAAAFRAGFMPSLHSPLLVLVHEPEAACVALTKELEMSLCDGDTVMVIDAGGGTVDFAVHTYSRSEQGLLLAQVVACDAVGTGGTILDHNFVTLVKQQLRISSAKWDEWKQQQPPRYCQFLQSWEKAKRRFGAAGQQQAVKVEVPRSLLNLLEPNVKKSIVDADDQLVLPAEQVKRMVFDPEVDQVVAKALQVLQQVQPAPQHCFLAGGFSDSPYLRQQLTKHLAWRIKGGAVHTGHDPGAAVLKGAVLLAGKQTVVTSRRAAVTYGVESRPVFVKGQMPKELKYWCKETSTDRIAAFNPVIHKGQLVQPGQTFATPTLCPLSLRSTGIGFPLYTTSHPGVEYIRKDGSMQEVGYLELELPDGWGKTVSSAFDRPFEARFTLDHAELVVTAVDLTSQREERTTIQFHARD